MHSVVTINIRPYFSKQLREAIEEGLGRYQKIDAELGQLDAAVEGGISADNCTAAEVERISKAKFKRVELLKLQISGVRLMLSLVSWAISECHKEYDRLVVARPAIHDGILDALGKIGFPADVAAGFVARHPKMAQNNMDADNIQSSWNSELPSHRQLMEQAIAELNELLSDAVRRAVA